MLAASLIPAAVQLGTSLYQMYQGNKLGKTARPDSVTPQAATQALNNAKMMASMTELPGQSRIEDKLAGDTASATDAIKQMGGGASGMGAIVDAYANENKQKSALEVEAANLWNANQGALRGQLGNIAGYQDAATQRAINEYNTTMGESSDLKGAAISNLFGAAKGGVNSYINNEMLKNAKQGLEDGTLTQEEYERLMAGGGINYYMFNSLLNNGNGYTNPSQING